MYVEWKCEKFLWMQYSIIFSQGKIPLQRESSVWDYPGPSIIHGYDIVINIKSSYPNTVQNYHLAEKLNLCWGLLPIEMANPKIKGIPVCEGTHSYKEKSCPKEYVSKHSGMSVQNLWGRLP